ncbi:hypothetical protein [Salsuginibacillus kocurii]|uniref:hypothetical protein n=1 Tax=Salsuginibacillus kocurii TaxID=427078 RepID=UPI00036B44EE|nr:hypothetical protein [Salsuginibacillus kocurii]
MKHSGKVGMISLILLLIGCSGEEEMENVDEPQGAEEEVDELQENDEDDEEKTEESNNETTHEVEDTSEEVDRDENDSEMREPSSADEDLIEIIAADASVQDVEVYEEDGKVVLTVHLGEDVSNEEAEALAETFAEEAQDTHAAPSVHVQLMKDEENLINLNEDF